ncbi:hypothetical protein TUM12370_22040 [Salmonella enterica subsp. enterica serovar Choleraesuis]|nr:hypothetical protein TUM12370_22040 [Salmonella enterica subsp. enterica serovar Choleraesuis]
MLNVRRPLDLPQILLSVVFLSIMILACLWIVQPFILGFAWAGTIVIATWPLLLWLQKILWGRRSLAVLVIVLLLILLFIIPIALLVNSLVDSSTPLIHWARSGHMAIPTLDWLKSIPMVGDKLHSSWNTLLATGGSALMAKVQPYIGTTTQWFLGQAAQIGSFLLHCGMMLLFSALLYWRGENVARGIRHFAYRLAAQRGDAAVVLAGNAIRAVALGVVVTALVQGLLGGIGLAISGIHYATMLAVLMFICCLVQLGPLPVLIPAVIWLYWSGDTTWGTVLLVWAGIVAALDNVIRPVLIRMGADLPLMLVLSGVIGGLFAFGMIGLFIGPVVLAVSYRLYAVWVHEVPEPHDSIDELKEALDASDPEDPKPSATL